MNKLKKLLILPVAAASLGLATLGATAQPAEAGSDCRLGWAFQGWSGGCRWGVTQLKVKCVDGPKVTYAYSAKGESRNHVARCGILYSPTQVWILHY